MITPLPSSPLLSVPMPAADGNGGNAAVITTADTCAAAPINALAAETVEVRQFRAVTALGIQAAVAGDGQRSTHGYIDAGITGAARHLIGAAEHQLRAAAFDADGGRVFRLLRRGVQQRSAVQVQRYVAADLDGFVAVSRAADGVSAAGELPYAVLAEWSALPPSP